MIVQSDRLLIVMHGELRLLNFKEGKNNPQFVEKLNLMTYVFYLLMNLTYDAPTKRSFKYSNKNELNIS